jgi:hypothetical protein
MPGFYYNDGGTWRTMSGVYYNDSGTWRTIAEAWYNDSGTWRKVWPNVTHHTSTISPNFVSGTGVDTIAPPSNVTATTNTTTVSIVSGGSGSYTYSWAHVSGDTFSVSDATAATTYFAKTALADGSTYTGVYRCTITDTGDGNYQTTQDVTVQTTHEYSPE